MKLSTLLATAELQNGQLRAGVPESWLQGRSAFGGLQAAIGVCAMRRLLELPASLPLRALQVGFVAPVPAGSVLVGARQLRTGKNVTQVEARLLGPDHSVLATMLGVFGGGRASQVSSEPDYPDDPQWPSQEFRQQPGLTPQFTSHFAARWRQGGLPFSGQREQRVVVDLDLLEPGPADESSLLAFADYIPPVALSWLSTPAPGSSLTWSLELLRHDFAQLPLQGWRIDARLLAAADGYTSQATRIFAPDRRLAAISQQSMVVFA